MDRASKRVRNDSKMKQMLWIVQLGHVRARACVRVRFSPFSDFRSHFSDGFRFQVPFKFFKMIGYRRESVIYAKSVNCLLTVSDPIHRVDIRC